MRHKPFIVVWSIATLILTLIATPNAALAQLSSSSFRMTSDSVNCGGGQSTSTSFSVFSTICEPASNQPTNNIVSPESTSFVLEQGFQYMEDTPFITASLLNPSNTAQAKNTVSYGTLTQSSGVASDSILVRVATNAPSGYSAALLSDGELRVVQSGQTIATIAGVSDGTVNGSPSGEIGFTTSGTDGQYNATDTNITTAAKTFAQRSTWTTQSDTTLTFKAAVTSGNASGSYTQSLTIVVTGSF